MERDLAQRPSGIVKVMLIGPESTGKTTLARDLARAYGTEWVPEYMRTYLQRKWDEHRQTCTPQDLLPIARGQMRDENRQAARARRILFSDTGLLELLVYARAYYNEVPRWLEEAASAARYDFYFLTYIDTPWVPDDLRDKPDQREEMFGLFRDELRRRGLPYAVLSGPHRQRMEKAKIFIDLIMDKQSPLTPADLSLLDSRGIDPRDVLEQIRAIGNGNLYVRLRRPAVPGDGIRVLDPETRRACEERYLSREKDLKKVKFVPASGAATRMFRDCFAVKNFFDRHPRATWDEMLGETGAERCADVDRWAKDLPFYEEVIARIRENHPDFEAQSPDERMRLWVKYLLEPEGLNYGQTPKGLVLFHRYTDGKRTAFEEHLAEAAHLGTQVHFTVDPRKESLFRRMADALSDRYAGTAVTYSYQSPSTDTVMLDERGALVRDDRGQLIFRPGGHGSLLKNLEIPDADLLWVKNIDNVQKDAYKADTYTYYRILAGYLLEKREKVFGLLEALDAEPSGDELNVLADRAVRELGISLIAGYDALPASHRRKYLRFKLHRPLRVAGMTVNRGAPGGGPFWVEDSQGNLSLQIVEKAQIQTDDPSQKAILEASTHFNPVFMVLSTKDYRGKTFDLSEFVMENTGFVTEKSLNGRPVRVYEHPGLWNGAMGQWLSWFVEVPESTFSPVKEFYDLLKVPHV